MAWGKSKPQPPPSTLRQLLPLIITLLVVGIGAWIGYQIYVSVKKIRATASERMSHNNVVFTKESVKVGVKHIKNESYVDATQSWVVKAWNLASEGQQQHAKKYVSRYCHGDGAVEGVWVTGVPRYGEGLIVLLLLTTGFVGIGVNKYPNRLEDDRTLLTTMGQYGI